MDEVILIESEESENSIVEVEVPKKPPPPIIDVDDDEILLNVKNQNHQAVLAKDIIMSDNDLTLTSCESTTEILKLVSPNHWTLDMMKFYNDDWGGEEEFIVEKIQEKMDKTPSLWEMSRKDVLNMHNKIKRSNVKCWNCCQRGHHVAMCPDPPHVPKCHMCGTPGHLDNNCPNSKCLNCGNPCKTYVTWCFKCRNQMKQVCTRCQLLGHNFINCTDHWRLYHLTTNSNNVKIPNTNIYKPDKDMWCCNCGRRGHVHTQCRHKKNFGGFTETLPFVASYHKAFNDNVNHKSNNNRYYNQPIETMKKFKQHKKESILRINPMHKAINRDKLKKHRKKNKKKKMQQSNRDFLLV